MMEVSIIASLEEEWLEIHVPARDKTQYLDAYFFNSEEGTASPIYGIVGIKSDCIDGTPKVTVLVDKPDEYKSPDKTLEILSKFGIKIVTRKETNE